MPRRKEELDTVGISRRVKQEVVEFVNPEDKKAKRYFSSVADFMTRAAADLLSKYKQGIKSKTNREVLEYELYLRRWFYIKISAVVAVTTVASFFAGLGIAKLLGWLP